MTKMIMKMATIIEINISGKYHKLAVKLDNDEIEHLIINDNVKVYENLNFSKMELEELDIGRRVCIYTYENTPIMLSMPPQYTPALIIVSKNEDYIGHKLDYFDENLLSLDKTIKINDAYLSHIESLSNKYLIKDLINNKQLLVFYQKSTRSIPAIVDPIKIIVL